MKKVFTQPTLLIAFLLGWLLLWAAPGYSAGFMPHAGPKGKAALVQQTVAQVQQYLLTKSNSYTIAGFEQYLGRKLSRKEKRIFSVYKYYTDLTPEEEASMIRNKRLGNLSMAMGIGGYVLAFIPIASVLTIALWPAAIITGIIAMSRAKQYNNRKGSGFASGLTGLLTGGLGLAISFLLVLLVLALWQ